MGADPQEYLWMQWNKCDCRAAEAEKGYLERIKQLEEKEKKLLKEIVDLKRVEPMCHCGIGYSDHRNTENHPFIDVRDNTNYWENPLNKEIRDLQSEICKMRLIAEGYADAAEQWRLMYGREHRFTSACCDYSISVKFLKIIEKGGVIDAKKIRDAVDQAVREKEKIENEELEESKKERDDLEKENRKIKTFIRETCQKSTSPPDDLPKHEDGSTFASCALCASYSERTYQCRFKCDAQTVGPHRLPEDRACEFYHRRDRILPGIPDLRCFDSDA
jgi:hypothetical protein